MEGPGEVIAVGNGDPVSDEPSVAAACHAFMGMALCVVRSTGETGRVRVCASSPGLERSELVLRCTGVT